MRIPTGSFSGPTTVAVRDFNHDDHLDIAVSNCQANNIGILLGKGNGTFNNQKTFATGYQRDPFVILASDFNQDGHLDLAAIMRGQLPCIFTFW